MRILSPHSTRVLEFSDRKSADYNVLQSNPRSAKGFPQLVAASLRAGELCAKEMNHADSVTGTPGRIGKCAGTEAGTYQFLRAISVIGHYL